MLKALRGRSALRNPCEGCHNLHRRGGAVGPYGQARQEVTFALKSKLYEMSFWGHQGVPLVSGTNAPSCVPEMLMSYTKDIVDYRGLSWISTSYHRVRDCLEMLLNIIEYRGLSWISASYHRIRDCLEMVLNIIEHRGLLWIIVE